MDSTMTDFPNDLLINARDEVAIRKHLALVALGKKPADTAIRVGRLLDVYGRNWYEDQEIVISGRRIAWVGPAGAYPGEVGERIDRSHLSVVPGFGEVHKHIESSHLTPEWEAALVLPFGCTWTCEASHEFSNVDGPHNLEFWMTARAAGSPAKIFPLPGSAVPPTAYEHGGGHFGYGEQLKFMTTNLAVSGLDEVMDWPAVWNPDNPSHERLWGMIEATFEARGVVEGHAAGMRAIDDINAFAGAGMASDHEAWTAEEVADKLRRGLFMELRPHSLTDMIKGLLERGQQDWSNFALCTDDRSCSDTMKLGATDHNVRLAIQAGLPMEVAVQMVTINPARHMRLTPWVGSISPGRYADLVFLDDEATLSISEVWADGMQVSKGREYIADVPTIDWPQWARQTVNIGRDLTAADFAIAAPEGATDSCKAALLRPFHWHDEFITTDLSIVDGLVQRDDSRNITKFAIVDRFSGTASVSKMFWLGTGPKTPNTALACSMGHDKHNIWAVGSSDEAMALAVNALQEQQGGWALVRDGKVLARVNYEIGGLMTCRPAPELDKEMLELYAQGETIEWMYEPTYSPRWWAGFPERLAFATLTCAPWRWVLVAPSPLAPEGFVNVQNGQIHPIVWCGKL
ncbi:adenine deaminase C-terminal domain-containing protein [Devosia sp. MC521]|uniref:adenine deaminase n=1 Tax=Devosia sp. MC521 TaxID=2759954 RepID=UPI0018F0AEDB|nr:adenine deaminase C-terminal domain-containing protein [Devosia sp. MC521]MBJ6987394.1 adenine deaminase [Devosia sp. MC521]